MSVTQVYLQFRIIGGSTVGFDAFNTFANIYCVGIAGVLWFVLWLFLVYDTPGRHPRISSKELKYIQNALGDQQSENIVSLWAI